MEDLLTRYQDNNLSLTVSMPKELVIDFRKCGGVLYMPQVLKWKWRTSPWTYIPPKICPGLTTLKFTLKVWCYNSWRCHLLQCWLVISNKSGDTRDKSQRLLKSGARSKSINSSFPSTGVARCIVFPQQSSSLVLEFKRLAHF